MPILNGIKCDICGAEQQEKEQGGGWPGWGAVNGIILDDVSNPCLCPEHLGLVADYLDGLKGVLNGLD